MTGAGRRSVGQHHGDLRRALIEATVDLLEEGERAPSLRQVARRAGVSPAAPYHHFGSRDGLMAAVAEAGFAELGRALHQAAEGAPDAQERLRRMTRAYVGFGLAHPAHYGTLFQPSDGPESPKPALQTAALATFEALVEAVRACRPDLAEPDVQIRARSSWATAHGGVILASFGAFVRLGGRDQPEAIGAEIADAVLRNVRL